MPRTYSERAADHQPPVDGRTAYEEAQRARAEQARKDEETREHCRRIEAAEAAARRESERRVAVAAVSTLESSARDAAVARLEAEIAARRWNAAMAQLVILPALQLRGDGELFVAFQRFDAGRVVTSSMPLAEAGVLLDPATSPTLQIPHEQKQWEAAQEAARVEEQRRQAEIERVRRLYERRKVEVARLQSTPPAHRAALLVAQELRASQPKLSAAFTRLAQHLVEDDTAALKKFVEETIADAEVTK